MNNGYKIFAAAAVFLLSLSEMVMSQTSLPAIRVKDTDNREHILSELAEDGKPTVVIFWATWCKPCIDELDNISDYYEDWVTIVDFNLITVCIDDSRTSSSVKSFVNGRDWPFITLLDINQEIKRAMNVTDIPHYYLFDSQGKLVKRHTGYLPGDEELLFDELQNRGDEK